MPAVFSLIRRKLYQLIGIDVAYHTTPKATVAPEDTKFTDASEVPKTTPTYISTSKEPRMLTGNSKRTKRPEKRKPIRKTDKIPQSAMTSSMFGVLSVPTPIQTALTHMGYNGPTAIQERVIPLVRQGSDLVGQAQTGTGKTAAFGIPIVELVNNSQKHVQALILVPTRELALQVESEISKIGEFLDMKPIAIYGGHPIKPQIESLRAGVQIVVATPGRLIDHMRRRTISLNHIRIAVLDEADQMLDIGFVDDIENILRQTPKSRQTLLFSATIPSPIKRLTRRYLKNPQWIRIGADAEPVDEVDQIYYEVAPEDRKIALKEILNEEVSQALIFRRTRIGVNRLVEDLKNEGQDVQGIHSDMYQEQRERVMTKFRSKALKILVATNVAARGLDIPAVSHVINFDMPDNLEEYVHRVGRTARMGRQGTAITFVSDMQDFELLDKLQQHFGNELRQLSFRTLYS